MTNSNQPTVYVALPAMDELDYLPAVLDCVKSQNYQNYQLFVCVNQPEEWWENSDKKSICESNKALLDFLKSKKDPQLVIIDKSSKGSGWIRKKQGVGWARKTIMDQIAKQAKNTDIIISMDADTRFNPGYFQSVVECFKSDNKAVALSVPYYHSLTGDEEKDRAILRYEIYLRYFAINLWRIHSPYSFTAIGSAIALPVSSYKAIGGITPHQSGEDFYFLQKLRKYGKVMFWNKEKVFPAARYSDRVGFGTGPAMIKGREGDWKSYPLYSHAYFDEVMETYDLFQRLFANDVDTPLDDFIRTKFGTERIWQPIRENFKSIEKFCRACHHKLDAFRVFQYLKWRSDECKNNDKENLHFFMLRFYPEKLASLSFEFKDLDFNKAHVNQLNELRDLLMRIEEEYQIQNK